MTILPAQPSGGRIAGAARGGGGAGGILQTAGKDATKTESAGAGGAQARSPNHSMQDAGSTHAAQAAGGKPAPDAPIEPGTSPDHAFADWPMPSALAGSKTAPSYATMSNTVLDNVTQLVWQRSLPNVYEGCTGNYGADAGVVGNACSWEEAKRYCASAAVASDLGGSGWRLPTKIELESILNEAREPPTIDHDAFPDTPRKAFWAATPYVSATGNAWTVEFEFAFSSRGEVESAYLVRCVR